MSEVWKYIEGSENKYMVSSEGRVKSYCKKTDKILKAINGKRYLYVNIMGSPKLIHRLVADHFIQKNPSQSQVNHINGIRNDNSAENLEWVTRIENCNHAKKLGLYANGERNGNCKLNPGIVRMIRERINNGLTAGQIGLIYGVKKGTILSLKVGRTWNHVI